jgi:hypothetical protein
MAVERRKKTARGLSSKDGRGVGLGDQYPYGTRRAARHGIHRETFSRLKLD